LKFGTFLVAEAEGCILAHGLRLDGVVFKKGHIVSADDIKILQRHGTVEIVAAQLEDSDVAEDVAARRIALAACGSCAAAQEAFTGRANIHASAAGVLVVDEVLVQALNHIHESLTLASLPNFARVDERHMLATIKVIPFAVPEWVLLKALEIIGDKCLLEVKPFQRKSVGLIITQLPLMKPQLLEKTEAITRARLVAMGCQLHEVVVCDHRQDAVQTALQHVKSDVVLVFGASAIVDRGDVIPAALVDAGGEVLHMGMPVDPGNLLMLGHLKSAVVIGVPTCARSPKTNGFDWVLERVMADIDVKPADLKNMGVGGLLAEIPSRPSPRERGPDANAAPRVAALVLAAGTSSRMGSNKLLADFAGLPMIAQTVSRIAKSSVNEVYVVTGNEADLVAKALQGFDVTLLNNPHFAEGLATSLRAGVAALMHDFDAILVCLGDMPLIDPRDIDRMIAAFNAAAQRSIVVPVHAGKFGNPVLWGAAHFTNLLACEGDRGARGLLEKLADNVVEVLVDNDGVMLDADTPEALAAMRHLLSTRGT
jgi:molybdenum cofactor cytidylyltransferase